MPAAQAPAPGLTNELTPFGLLALDIDPATLTATPVRAGSSGLESVNLTSYLGANPCSDCIRPVGIGLRADGLIELTIGIRHPFRTGDPTQPPSAANRLDLHVFNVEAVVISDQVPGRTEFPELGQAAGTPLVRNPDGFSANLSPALLTPIGADATLYPYKLFFEDYSSGSFDPGSGFADVRVPSGFHVMRQGSPEDRRTFVLDLPAGGDTRIYLAAQASWGLSATSLAQRLTPTYRLPQFTKKAADEAFVSIAQNFLQPGEVGSEATIDILMLDADFGAPVGAGLGELDFASTLGRIDLEIPGVLISRIVRTNPTPISGDPANPNQPARYRITIQNTAAAPTGTYLGLVRLLDTYPASATGAALENLDVLDAPGPPGDPLANGRQLTDYATYVVFPIDVAPLAGCVQPPAFVAAAPPDPILGEPYSYTFTAEEGTGALSFALTSGVLPSGLSLAANGTLSGVAADRDDFYTAFPITVEVRDSCEPPRTDTVALTLHVDLQPLTAVYFNVEQGHATLVYSAAGEAILVDMGPIDPATANPIRTYLSSRGLHLKYVIATHADADHHGGARYIMCGADGEPGVRNIDDDGDSQTDDWEDEEEWGWPGSDDLVPEAAFDPGNDDLEDQQSDRIYRYSIHRARVPWSTALLGDPTLFDLDEPGFEAFLGAGNRAIYDGTDPGRDTNDENSNSLSLLIRHGAFDLELGGDLGGSTAGDTSNVETPLALALADDGISLDAMLLHHHGSDDSSNSTWLSVLDPNVILIQLGENPYGHVHQPVFDRIASGIWASGELAQLYMSSQGTIEQSRFFDGVDILSSPAITIANGDITIVIDGRTYSVTTPLGTDEYEVDEALP